MTFPVMNAELLDIIYNHSWLNPDEQRVFELRYRQGLLYYQIAQEVNCSERTIRRMFERILKKAHPNIIKYYDEHPEYCDLKVSD